MYKILIADDEPIEIMVISKKLREAFPDQITLFTAANGKEAVDVFEENACEIAILDISMPCMTGLEAAEHIKKNDPGAGIIFLTAFDDFSYAKKAIEVRALDYILKPAKEAELFSVLEAAFENIDQSGSADTMRINISGIGRAMESRSASISVTPAGSTSAGTDLEKTDSSNREDISLRMKYFAGDIKKFLEEHFKEDISLQDVASCAGYSDAYFCKLFKQYFDKSFIMYLNELRVNKAKEMLADMSINIKDVSAEAGFRDANYFAKVFKRATGLSPKEFRAQIIDKA